MISQLLREAPPAFDLDLQGGHAVRWACQFHRLVASLLKIVALAAEQIHEHEAALTADQAMARLDETHAVAILQDAYAAAEVLKNTGAQLQIASKLQALRPSSSVFASGPTHEMSN